MSARESDLKKYLKKIPEISKLKVELEKEISARSKQLAEANQKFQAHKNKASSSAGKMETIQSQLAALQVEYEGTLR